VDAGGGGNYTTIQVAIDAANAGDTVRVWAGMYNEELVIKKSMELIGNGTNNTTIKGKKSNSVIEIDRTNNVKITGFTLTASGIGDFDAGILIYNSDFCNIYNNNISNNGGDGIHSYYSSNCSIKNNTILNNDNGIFLFYSDNNIFEKNVINFNDKDGIFINGKWGNYLENNFFESNGWDGIEISSHSKGQILNNTCKNNGQSFAGSGIRVGGSFSKIFNNTCISNNGRGIYIGGINNTIGNNYCFDNEGGLSVGLMNNLIFNNNCTNNSDFGISSGSGYNKIWNNTMLNCGLYFNSDDLVDWVSLKLPPNNTVNNKPIHFLKNQTSGKVPTGVPQVILANCSNIVIENQSLRNLSYGIIVAFSNNITINNNTNTTIRSVHSTNTSIFNNILNKSSVTGISISSSSNITIFNNTCKNNEGSGIGISSSKYIRIFNNTCENNEGSGIALSYSKNNKIIDNICNLNINGILFYYSSNNFISNNSCSFNNVDGMRISLEYNSQNNIIKNNSFTFNQKRGILYMGNGVDFYILNNDFSNNSYGIYLMRGSNTIIRNNTFKYNQNFACNFYESEDNEIAFNLIESNKLRGFYLDLSNNNTIYNNRLINNSYHAYDNGNNIWNLSKPNGGNYWDNWTLPDNNMDGFVDYPFIIQGGNNKDYLPLVIINSSYYRVHNINKNTSYTSIQAGIDDANVNDTIRVWAGTFYENVKVTKSLNIIGNSSTNTTIDGGKNKLGFNIKANFVNISGFKIINNSNSGIELDKCNKCRIFDNNITNNQYGIYLRFTDNNLILNNTIVNNDEYGLYISNSYSNTVDNNHIELNGDSGIYIRNTNLTKIVNNTCNSNLDGGMRLWYSCYNQINNNTVNYNSYSGISNSDSTSNLIVNNKLDSNTETAIYLQRCKYISINNNSMTECGIYLLGYQKEFWNKHQIKDNTINNKNATYIKNATAIPTLLNIGQLILANCSNITLENHTCNNGSSGIQVGFSENMIIQNNFCKNNTGYGIQIVNSNNTSVLDNNLSSNDYIGLGTINSNFNKIKNNTVVSNQMMGTMVYNSSKTNFSNNIVNLSGFYGGSFVWVDNSTIFNNTFFLNNKSMYLFYTSNTSINENYMVNNTDGLYAENITNTAFRNNLILNNSKYGFYLANSEQNEIVSNNVSKNDCGIFIYNSTLNEVENNNLTQNNNTGIGLLYSKWNWILNNTCVNNSNTFSCFSIYLFRSENNQVINNSCTLNDYGIYLREATSNYITGNNLIGNDHGIECSGSSQNYIYYNNCSEGENGLEFYNSTSNKICNNNCSSNNGRGIFLAPYSTSNNILNNTFQSNIVAGIDLLNSETNLIINNTIKSNGYGIYIESQSNFNYLYYNSIIKNVQQALDKGTNYWNNTAHEGNYWSDYTGLDNGNGSRPKGDGIGDTKIPHYKVDHYPFVRSYGWYFPGTPILNDSGKINTNGTYTINWNATRGTMGYILQEDISNQFSSPTLIYTGPKTGFQIKNKNNGTYYYRLRSFNSLHESNWSNIINVTVNWLPSAPTLLKFSSKGGTYNNITWNASISPDVEGYEIYVNNTGSTTQFHHLTNTTNTYFNHTSLAQETTYYYKVRAFDEVPLYSTFSNTISTKTLDITPPDPPTNLNFIKYGGKFIFITWTGSSSSDVQGYEIFTNDTGSNVNFHYLTTTTNTYFNHTGLAQETTYYYIVRARDEVPLFSLFSNTVSVTTLDVTPPSPPTGLTTKDVSGHSITLTWDANPEPDIAGYHIYMNNTGVGSLGPFHRIHTIIGTNTEFIVSGLVDSTLYHFTIIAFDEVPNNSSRSNVVSATTLDVTPPKVSYGSGDIETTTGETFSLYVMLSEKNGFGLIKLFYTKDSVWEEMEFESKSYHYYSISNLELSIDTSNNTTPWKYYFYAEDTSGNFVYYGTEEVPFIITVIDNDEPVADAGEDIDGEEGTKIILDASNSTDNIGITNYTWTFKYNNEQIVLYGKIATFRFDIWGNYEITLSISDAAGNTESDKIVVEIYYRIYRYIELISPLDQAKVTGPEVTLQWVSSCNAPCILTYNVYFGTTPDPPLYKSNFENESLNVLIFEELVNYYWKVQLIVSGSPGPMSDTRSFQAEHKIPYYGLEIISDKTEVVIVQGQSESVNITVKNTQLVCCDDDIKLELDIGEFPGEVVLSNYLVHINLHDYQIVFLNLSTTSSTEPGIYFITITGISQGALEYSLDVNKSLIIEIEVKELVIDDSDNDNLPDSWEEQWFGNIGLFNGSSDPDLDGKTNYQEYMNGTDPTKPDIDKKPEKPEKKGEDNSNLIIILVVTPIIISVLLLFLVFFIILKKKKGGGRQPET
jgi:parallel beta-helix repeat protein